MSEEEEETMNAEEGKEMREEKEKGDGRKDRGGKVGGA